MTIPVVLDKSLRSQAPWLFLSPHLDDAVLSCAALIEAFSSHREITVATLFTEAEPPPHTRAARSFLAQCSRHDAMALFEDRRREDEAALATLGATPRHLGVTDALFRRRRKAKKAPGPLAKLLPELVHLYPTYRFDIALGRISRSERELIGRLRDEVSLLLQESGAEVLFCPVGVGQHVDHLITRAVGEGFPDRVIYYSDFPYNQSGFPDLEFLQKHGLIPWIWDSGLAGKERYIKKYDSQASALFPNGIIPVVPETYYATG